MANPDHQDEAAMRARLDKLSGDIEARREPARATARQESVTPADGGMGQGMTMAFRVVTELVAGILVGGAIGWGLDRLLHTKPLLLIVFGLLGTAGGFWNIVRQATPKGRAAAVDFNERLDASRRRDGNGDN